MTVWVYNNNMNTVYEGTAAFKSSDGTNYPGNYPKAEIAGLEPVVDLAPTGTGSIKTYGTPTRNEQTGVISRTVALSQTDDEADADRIADYKEDAGCIDTLDKFENMTLAQFDQWFTDNVTTLAQARTALKRLAWVTLLLYKRKI